MRLFRAMLAATLLLGLCAFGVLAAKQRTAKQVVLGRVASSLAGVQVADARGGLRSAVPEGGGVVLVLSTTCPHCHAVVRALASRAADGPLPRLHVVALEGAAGGDRVLRDLGLDARVSGAYPDIARFLARLGISGTPVLLAVSPRGDVEKAVFGEISESEAEEWVELASGPAGMGAPAGPARRP